MIMTYHCDKAQEEVSLGSGHKQLGAVINYCSCCCHFRLMLLEICYCSLVCLSFFPFCTLYVSERYSVTVNCISVN